MPRLTPSLYLILHHQLSQLWDSDKSRFSLLSFKEQQYLHDYFAPSWSWISDEDLLRYRSKISKDEPSLPAAAGRAAAKFRRRLDTAPVRAAAPKATGQGRVVVKSVIRPTSDEDRMAAALRRIFQDFEEQDSSDRAA